MLSAGKVCIVQPLSNTASSYESRFAEGKKLQTEKGEEKDQKTEEQLNCELELGLKPASIRNHIAL